ncbi:MAG: hypothetical protein KA028_00230 [Candidatus Pacebacteria bacterium]|nr:hypothetical protein [Candidatus Paceibacterota bacterium]MBP9851850.1 hypothetical protein [Candidatus Paceibacterota bacterium]
MKKVTIYFLAIIGLATATGCASNKPQPLSQAYPQKATPVGTQPATEYAGDDVYNQGQPMPETQYDAQYSQQYQQSAPQYYQDQRGNTFYYGSNGAIIYVSMGVSVGSQSQCYPPQTYPQGNQYTQPANTSGFYQTANPYGTAGGMDGSRQLAEANYIVSQENNYLYSNSQPVYTYDQYGNVTGEVVPDQNGIYGPRGHVGQRNGNPAVNPNQNTGYQNNGYQKNGNMNNSSMSNGKMRNNTDQRIVQQNNPNQKVVNQKIQPRQIAQGQPRSETKVAPQQKVVQQNSNFVKNNNQSQPRKKQ